MAFVWPLSLRRRANLRVEHGDLFESDGQQFAVVGYNGREEKYICIESSDHASAGNDSWEYTEWFCTEKQIRELQTRGLSYNRFAEVGRPLPTCNERGVVIVEPWVAPKRKVIQEDNRAEGYPDWATGAQRKHRRYRRGMTFFAEQPYNTAHIKLHDLGIWTLKTYQLRGEKCTPGVYEYVIVDFDGKEDKYMCCEAGDKRECVVLFAERQIEIALGTATVLDGATTFEDEYPKYREADAPGPKGRNTLLLAPREASPRASTASAPATKPRSSRVSVSPLRSRASVSALGGRNWPSGKADGRARSSVRFASPVHDKHLSHPASASPRNGGKNNRGQDQGHDRENGSPRRGRDTTDIAGNQVASSAKSLGPPQEKLNKYASSSPQLEPSQYVSGPHSPSQSSQYVLGPNSPPQSSQYVSSPQQSSQYAGGASSPLLSTPYVLGGSSPQHVGSSSGANPYSSGGGPGSSMSYKCPNCCSGPSMNPQNSQGGSGSSMNYHNNQGGSGPSVNSKCTSCACGSGASINHHSNQGGPGSTMSQGRHTGPGSTMNHGSKQGGPGSGMNYHNNQGGPGSGMNYHNNQGGPGSGMNHNNNHGGSGSNMNHGSKQGGPGSSMNNHSYQGGSGSGMNYNNNQGGSGSGTNHGSKQGGPGSGMNYHNNQGGPGSGMNYHSQGGSGSGMNYHNNQGGPGSSMNHGSKQGGPGSSANHHSYQSGPGSSMNHGSKQGGSGSGMNHHSNQGGSGSGMNHHSYQSGPGSGMNYHNNQGGPGAGMNHHNNQGGQGTRMNYHNNQGGSGSGTSNNCGCCGKGSGMHNQSNQGGPVSPMNHKCPHCGSGNGMNNNSKQGGSGSSSFQQRTGPGPQGRSTQYGTGFNSFQQSNCGADNGSPFDFNGQSPMRRKSDCYGRTPEQDPPTYDPAKLPAYSKPAHVTGNPRW